MGNPGLDPETALQLIHTLLYCIACILGGSALLGLSAYVVFVCWEIFSPRRSSKTLQARVLQPIGCVPVAEENLDPVRAETPIPAEAERLDVEGVRAPSLSHDTPTQMALVPITVESRPTGPRGFFDFLRFRRAVAPTGKAPFEFES